MKQGGIVPQEEHAMPCRACDGTLNEVSIPAAPGSTRTGEKDSPAWMCGSCGSTLVETRDLIPVLSSASAAVVGAVDLDAPIDAVPAQPAPACPDCDRDMTQFGYMGTNLAFPSRCSACNLIWMPGEVLGAMTLLFARTNLRHEHQLDTSAAQADEMSRRMSAVVMGRVRTSWLL